MAEADTPEGDAFDPWYCNARPVWSSLVHLIPVSEDLLRRCVATGILNEQQVFNIKAIPSQSNRYYGDRLPGGYYTCAEKDTPHADLQKLLLDTHAQAPERLREWAMFCEMCSTLEYSRTCSSCKIYTRRSEPLLHELRRGGKDSFYKFWQCLAASFNGYHLIDALCSFMSDRTLVLVDAKPVRGKKKKKKLG